MVASTLFTLLLASTSALFVRADVTPQAPGPGAVFKQGDTCLIQWKGDADSKTVWKNMAIELMTGDNFNMVHLTTVATNQDGTVDGKFEYPCPEVTPNSAIYFYQFSNPNTPTLTWTTRFTIAGADGSTTPPSENTQPGTNDPIPWGTGALKDPSKGTPPPSFAVASGGSSAASSSAPSSTSSSAPASNPLTVISTSSARSAMTTARTSQTTGAPAAGQTGAPGNNANTAGGNNSNAALESVRFDKAIAVLVGSALTFTFLF